MPRIEGKIYSCNICRRKWKTKEEAEICEEIHRQLQEIGKKARKAVIRINKGLRRKEARVKINDNGEAQVICSRMKIYARMKIYEHPQVIITKNDSKVIPENILNLE